MATEGSSNSGDLAIYLFLSIMKTAYMESASIVGMHSSMAKDPSVTITTFGFGLLKFEIS